MKSFRSIFGRKTGVGIWILILAAGFILFTVGISHNPPGYYVDESALSYNAYLVSQTGAGEFGGKFPLFFQIYTGGFTQYANPTQIYILAGVFSIFGPGILTARLTAAFSVYAACVLLGFLAARISMNRTIGIMIGVFALITPWLFEISRLVLETFFYPMAVVLFLWAVYSASKKERWSIWNMIAIVVCLALLTYTYTIGRLLAPLLAFGLISFATSRKKLLGVIKTWAIYALTLVPLLVFYVDNPDLTTRFQLVGIIKPESTVVQILTTLIDRFFQDINPMRMILRGDTNARHHIPDALGSFYAGVFILLLIGIVIILTKRYRDAFWRFVTFGLFASVIPGSLTVDPFHTLRMVAFPIFALITVIPALEWFFAGEIGRRFLGSPKGIVLAILLSLTGFEAAYFHFKYYKQRVSRGAVFDAPYKLLYDQAVRESSVPIYLRDGRWGPAYIHALWYSTLEGRDRDQFVHLPYGNRAPANSLVLSSEESCFECVLTTRSGVFILYKQLPPGGQR